MKTFRTLGTVTLLVAILAIPATAQISQSLTLHSQQDAARVLSRAIEAAGGFETLRNVRTVTQKFELASGTVGQAPRPELETGGVGRPLTWVRSSDLQSGSSYIDVFVPMGPEGSVARFIISNNDSKFLRIPQKIILPLTEDRVEEFGRRMPFIPGFLLNAWERSTSLRYVGSEQTENVLYDVISFVDNYSKMNTLYFDHATGLLTRSELVVNGQFGPHGDIPQSFEFSDYTDTDGISLPGFMTETIGPYLTATVTLTETTINGGFDDSLMVIPDDFTESPGTGEVNDDMEVTEVAAGVYQIFDVSPAYHITFVESDDYVTVLDALVSAEMGRRVIDKIAETVPGKPVRDLVLTHYHFDHSAALISYIANGTTILTTAGNQDYVRQVAAAPRVRYDGIDPIEVDVRTVESRQSLGVGLNRYVVYDVGPNHADEILIVYFPEQRIVYVADIYEYNEGTTPPPLLVAFADKMDELGLAVETFIAAHGRPKTYAQYVEAVIQARAAPAPPAPPSN